MLTRRTMLQSGAAAGFLAALPMKATAASQGVNPELLGRARAALQTNRRQIEHRDLFAIADFTKPSREQRFYLVNSASGTVTSYHVAHGRGSDPEHCGYVDRFSNHPGSAASSAGTYVTGDFYQGKYGRSMRLHGLDHTNSNAAGRGIVIHAAPYAEPEVIDRMGKLGRSEGCFALSQLSLSLVLARLGPGTMLYCDKL